MSGILHRRVLNAGITMSHIATTGFFLEAAAGHPGKPVIMVLDYTVLSGTAEDAKAELEILFDGPNLIPEAAQERLLKHAGLTRYAFAGHLSGLWKYRGRGRTLVRPLVRAALRAPAPRDLAFPTGTGSFDVMKDKTLVGEVENYRKAQVRVPETTDYAVGLAAKFLADAVRAGIRPIIVIPPLHWTHATAEVNAATVRQIRALAEPYHLTVLNYLDNDSEFAHTDDFFWEPAHPNEKGMEAFSARLASDLKAVLP